MSHLSRGLYQGMSGAHGRVVTGLLILCVVVFALHQINAVDVWWRLAAGRWIVEHGIPSTDPFSYAFPARAANEWR